ncbi:MAG: phospholipase D family protein [Desulfosarcina sp.]|jgi:putative cardiolipin synthase
MKKRIDLFFSLFLIVFLLFGCASLPENVKRTPSTAYQDTSDTTFGRVAQALQEGQSEETSGYLLLNNGLDAFVARARLAQMAEKSIDTQYYMIHNDVVGSLFVDQLIEAAERGVRVRILVDDIDQGGRDFGTAVLDSQPNIEVRIFNPFARNRGRISQYVTGFGRQTRRAHNKSFTVDNQATILGGRNIGDEYFEADPELAFIDIDVLSIGPVANRVSASFDQYWNSELSYPISALVEKAPTESEIIKRKSQFDAYIDALFDSAYLKALRDSDLSHRLKDHQVSFQLATGTVVADDPEKLTHDIDETRYRLTEQLRPFVQNIQEELIISSPYFVPGKSGVAFFQRLREKGVRVRILTNSLSSTDVSIVHAGYARYRKALLRMGVELYELNVKLTRAQQKARNKEKVGRSKSSLHAKAFVMDRETVFIGSLNLDPRSIVQNTEIGVVFKSSAIASRLADGFDNNIDKAAFRLELKKSANGAETIHWHGYVDGNMQTLRHEPYTGFWKRFGIGLMRILPIESQI